MDLIHKKKENRAQIFQSFDSLKGFKEMIQECEVEIVSPRILSQDDYEILNERVHEIQKGKLVTIEYYDRIHYKRITGNSKASKASNWLSNRKDKDQPKTN